MRRKTFFSSSYLHCSKLNVHTTAQHSVCINVDNSLKSFANNKLNGNNSEKSNFAEGKKIAYKISLIKNQDFSLVLVAPFNL